MKNNKKVLLIFLLHYIFFTSCTKDSTSVDAQLCNFDSFNAKFLKITRSSTYESVKSIFGTEGDNFRNDLNGTSQIKYYKWYPCSEKNQYVQCWFQDGRLLLAMKSFKNDVCSNRISTESFSQLNNGMTYEQVRSLLNSNGDNFRNDYNTETIEVKYYYFYDCSDRSKYIQVWFQNNSAILMNKNF